MAKSDQHVQSIISKKHAHYKKPAAQNTANSWKLFSKLQPSLGQYENRRQKQGKRNTNNVINKYDVESRI